MEIKKEIQETKKNIKKAVDHYLHRGYIQKEIDKEFRKLYSKLNSQSKPKTK